MIPTQACRFRELQNTRFEGKGNKRKAKSHYSLKEAARLLRSEVDEILLDWLVIENFLLDKRAQPAWKETVDWQKSVELD